MKSLNTALILNYIRREGTTSRRSIAEETGLTAGAITILISDLLNRGLVEECGLGISSGGRKSTLLRLKGDAVYSVGVELTATQIIGVVCDFNARVITNRVIDIDPRIDSLQIIEQMLTLIEDIITTSRVPRKRICGIGLAIPGPSDYRRGIMLNPPNFPGWVNVRISDMIQRRTGLTVYTSKETSCAALAEFWYGSAQGEKRIFAMHVDEIGIGGAFVLDGDVFQSSTKETMNIGHTTVQTDGHVCACGNRGCLEAQANSAAAVRYAVEYATEHPECASDAREGMRFDDLLKGLEAGDIACVEAIKKCAYYISVALRNIIMLLAPDKIYCGGTFIDRCPMLMERLITYLNRELLRENMAEVKVLPFKFGKENGAIGATAIVYTHFSNREGTQPE